MNLQRLMDLKGINQVELSERSGVGQGLISSYLRGGRAAKYPTIANLLKLSKALGCTPNELLGWPGNDPLPAHIIDAAAKLASLPPDHPTRKAIETLLGLEPGSHTDDKPEEGKKD